MYVGIDIGGTNIKIATLSATGQVLKRGLIATMPARGPKDALARIHVAASSLVGARKVRGVGIGCAGLIDVERGRLRSSPNLKEWDDTPLRHMAEREFGLFTWVDNDATCAAFGEYQCGRNQGARDLIFITLGTGVGGGVISDGSIVRGVGNYGGEVGHVCIVAGGRRCRCGARGCLEAYAGGYGMVRTARELLKQQRSRYLSRWVEARSGRLSPRLIAEAAARGDRIGRAVMKVAGEALGTAIGSFLNVFNPSVVVIGGGVGGAFDLLQPHITTVVSRQAFAEVATQARIVPSSLGNDACVIGAAMFARQQVKKSP